MLFLQSQLIHTYKFENRTKEKSVHGSSLPSWFVSTRNKFQPFLVRHPTRILVSSNHHETTQFNPFCEYLCERWIIHTRQYKWLNKVIKR